MKKMFFLILILILLAGNLSLVAKNYYSEKEIRVSGFEGKKSLKELTLIAVSYPESPDDWYLEEAYKGETKDSFLKRLILLQTTLKRKNLIRFTNLQFLQVRILIRRKSVLFKILERGIVLYIGGLPE